MKDALRGPTLSHKYMPNIIDAALEGCPECQVCGEALAGLVVSLLKVPGQWMRVAATHESPASWLFVIDPDIMMQFKQLPNGQFGFALMEGYEDICTHSHEECESAVFYDNMIDDEIADPLTDEDEDHLMESAG